MGQNTGAGDVGRLDGIGVTFAVSTEEFDELVHQMGVGAAVAGTLGEAEMVFAFFAAVDTTGGERRDFIGKKMGVVRALDALGNLGLGLAGSVDDELLSFDERPFHAFFIAVDFDGLAVLAGDIEEGTVDEAGEVGVLEFHVAAFDGIGRSVAFVHFFADRAGSEAGNVFGLMTSKAEEGADAVGRVVHGGKAGPVSGPAFHVLLVGGLEELELAELALVVEFLHEEEFAGVDDGFHHHVAQSGRGAEIDDGLAVLDRGGHGNSAGDVFARFQSGNCLLGVVRDGGVEVDGIDLGISEEFVVTRVAFCDAKFVADLVERGLGPLADGDKIGVWMPLVDGDKFGSEAEADDCDIR